MAAVIDQTSHEKTWKSLWGHQRGAVDVVRAYLRERSAGTTEGSALVHVPTGGGKSGIIAYLACCVPEVDSALLVVPRKSLRRQLADDVRERFWAKLRVEPTPKPVLELLPSGLSAAIEALDQPTVLVATYQALSTVRREHPILFRKLADRLSLVAVDEGHYEPGPLWGKTIRTIRKPVVLFTATPYRNDLQCFSVDRNHIYSFSYHDAVRAKCLRRVEFQFVPKSRSAKCFVAHILQFFDGPFKELCPVPHEQAKVMIRCATQASVARVANALKRATKRGVVAVHEGFPARDGDHLYRDVPDPRQCTETFWVHQYKLMEGIDDPDFVLLAIYEPLKNARALVQQVGRVIRVTRATRQTAFVLVDPDDGQHEFWRNYAAFERHGRHAIEAQFESEEPVSKILAELASAQPVARYILDDFRLPLDPNEADLEDELLLRPATRLLRTTNGFEPEMLRHNVLKDAPGEHRVTLRVFDDLDGAWLHLFVANYPSPLLKSSLFVEQRLGYTFFRVVPLEAEDEDGATHLLHFYDSLGRVPEYLKDHTLAMPAEELHRLLSQSDRLVSVTIDNSDFGLTSLRAKTLRAHDITTVAPGIDDFSWLPRRARVVTPDAAGKSQRRSVAFTRASVSDETYRFTVSSYLDWLDEVTREVTDTHRRTWDTFIRYAEIVKTPSNTGAASLLLDVEDVRESFTSATDPLAIEDVCVDVTKAGNFKLALGGNQIKGKITYNDALDNYDLVIDAFDLFWNTEGITLSKYLNDTQSFRVVNRTRSEIYAHNSWFAPRVPAGGGGPWKEVLGVFEPDKTLGAAETEKGKPREPPPAYRKRDTWQKKSLFRLIQKRQADNKTIHNILRDFDILVCDDMRTEAADFIGADTQRRRVVFMHLKAFKDARTGSASAFQEVCAQAVKNLEYLHPYSERKPPNLGGEKGWDGQWKANKLDPVCQRIWSEPTLTGEEAWKKIHELVHDPRTEREVWVVMGQGFKLDEFRKRVEHEHGKKESAQDVQILYLVRSTWSSVGAIGARFRAIVSP